MKKRILSLLLSFCLLVAAFPVSAAAQENVTSTGLQFYFDQVSSATYTAGDGTIKWDKATRTLTLDNATINVTDPLYTYTYGIEMAEKYVSGIEEINVILLGTNSLTCSKEGTVSTGLSANGLHLNFCGGGSLTVTGGTGTSSSTGMKCQGVTVENGTSVTAIGGNCSRSCGLSCTSGNITIDGTLEVRSSTTYSDGIGLGFNGSTSNPIPLTVTGKLVAVGSIPIGNGSVEYQNNVTIKGATTEGGELSVLPANKTSFTSSDGFKYVEIIPAKAAQATFSITGQPTGTIRYGDTFKLGTQGGSGTGAVTWAVKSGSATVDIGGTVNVTGVGEIVITATKAGGDDYQDATAEYTFTAGKAIPDIGTVGCSTSPIYPGTQSSNVTLTRTDSTVEGTLALKAGTVFELGTKEYDWEFTPTDTTNYETTRGKVSLTVTKAPLQSIAVTTQPNKKTYTFGDTFDPAGMVVTATYVDNTTAEITPTFDSALSIGQTALTLSYTENGVSKTCNLSGLTVDKKAGSALTAAVSVRYNDTTTQQFDVSTLLPADCGTISSITATPAADGIIASAAVNKDTKKVSWNLKSDLTSTVQSETITIKVATENYSDITITLTVTTTTKTPLTITGVSAQNAVYNGTAHTGYTGTPQASGYTGQYDVAYVGGSAPTTPGTYTVTISIPDSNEDYTGSLSLTFTVAKAKVTVKADDKTVKVGGTMPELTATVSGLANGETLKTQPTLSCDADLTKAGTYPITASGAEVPDGGNYESAVTYQPGTLTVQADSSGGNQGGTTTPVTPPAKDEVTPSTTVTGTTANSTVTASQGESLVEAAKQPGTGEVTVKVDAATDVTEANVTLPASTLKGVGEVKTDMKIETPVAEITLPSEALKGLGTGASNVTVSSVANSDDTTSITVKKDNTVVNALNQPMKATLPAKDAKSTTAAYLVDDKGNETILPKSISGDGEMNLLLSGSAKIKLKDNAKTFTDTANHWANKDGSIDYATSHELFQGTGAGVFEPDTAMTRGMIVTVLHRLESKPQGGSVSFSDVPAGAYFAEAVAWGNENDIVKGTGANFQPDENVTREQLATFLYRYASAYGVDTSGRTNLAAFPDAGNVSGYAKDALEWAYHTGLIKGGDDGRLDPTGSATRAQVAAILMRFVEYINQ